MASRDSHDFLDPLRPGIARLIAEQAPRWLQIVNHFPQRPATGIHHFEAQVGRRLDGVAEEARRRLD